MPRDVTRHAKAMPQVNRVHVAFFGAGSEDLVMFQTALDVTLPKPLFYRDLAAELGALVAGEDDWVANAANTSAMIFDSLPDVNWAGFYLLRGGELVLGPFQGKPACLRIPLGRGVCGTAAAERRTVLVADVLSFQGHIACDVASRAELVVPLVRDGKVLGVLDLDSPRPARFDADDAAGIEALAAIFVAASPTLVG